MTTQQHPHAPHPYGYPPHYPAPPQHPRNGFGITALCLAIPGVLFGLIPILGFFAVILGALGMIFGCIGWGRAQRGIATNKVMSIISTFLAAGAITLGIIGIGIVINAAEEFDEDLQEIEEDFERDMQELENQ
ncbi:hypothetical protein [Streptomyces sp. B6B3]|uniref:hypothetical protein n=1 Tax=Streptomyces sp. B6B3 TaxID=3153570 RepID=UPI00325D8216